MAQVNINIRMDSTVKKQAEELFSDLGLNMTTAFNMFVRQAINKGGIPFDVIRKEDFYNEHNQEKLRESIKSTKHVTKSMDELEKIAQ